MTTLRRNITIPEPLDLAIAEVAAHFGVTYSEYIRAAVVWRIEQDTDDTNHKLRKYVSLLGKRREKNEPVKPITLEQAKAMFAAKDKAAELTEWRQRGNR